MRYFKSHEIDDTINFDDYNTLEEIVPLLMNRHFVYKNKMFETSSCKIIDRTKLLIRTFSTSIVAYLSDVKTIELLNVVEPKTGKRLPDNVRVLKPFNPNMMNVKTGYTLEDDLRMFSKSKHESWADVATVLGRTGGPTVFQRFNRLRKEGVTKESLIQSIKDRDEELGIVSRTPNKIQSSEIESDEDNEMPKVEKVEPAKFIDDKVENFDKPGTFKNTTNDSDFPKVVGKYGVCDNPDTYKKIFPNSEALNLPESIATKKDFFNHIMEEPDISEMKKLFTPIDELSNGGNTVHDGNTTKITKSISNEDEESKMLLLSILEKEQFKLETKLAQVTQLIKIYKYQ